jgi:hypothetical protein
VFSQSERPRLSTKIHETHETSLTPLAVIPSIPETRLAPWSATAIGPVRSQVPQVIRPPVIPGHALPSEEESRQQTLRLPLVMSWIGSTFHGLDHDVRHHANPSMKLIAGFVYVPIEPLHSIIHIEGAFRVDRGLYRLLKLHHNGFEVVKVVLLVLLYNDKFFAAEVTIYETLASEPNRKNASCLVYVPLVLLLETTLFCPWAVAKF